MEFGKLTVSALAVLMTTGYILVECHIGDMFYSTIRRSKNTEYVKRYRLALRLSACLMCLCFCTNVFFGADPWNQALSFVVLGLCLLAISVWLNHDE